METTDIQIFKKTVITDEKDHIFIQFICDLFEINRENQARFIQNDPILAKESTKKSKDSLFGDNRLRVCLTKKGFIRWIQLINPNIVKPELKEKLIQYQTMVFDYIYGEGVIPNIRRQFDIELEMREVSTQISALMKRQKALQWELRDINRNNYQQLGLRFPGDELTGAEIKSLQ